MSRASETREDYAWHLVMPTRWIDNDRYGHMNNAVYYSVFENIIMRWLEVEHDLDPNSGDVRCFTVENGCTYHDAVRYPEVLDVGLRVARLGNSSVRYELGIFAQGRETVAATGFVVDVFVNAETERPITIPQDFRQVLGQLQVGS